MFGRFKTALESCDIRKPGRDGMDLVERSSTSRSDSTADRTRRAAGRQRAGHVQRAAADRPRRDVSGDLDIGRFPRASQPLNLVVAGDEARLPHAARFPERSRE